MNCGTQGLPVHHQHPEFTQTHVHRVGDAIEPSHSLSSPSPPAFNPSQHRAISSSVIPFSSCPQSLPESVFSNESTLHIRWPKYWSFSLSIGPYKEHPGLISFRMELIGSPCSPRDSQESSPTPQFKSINSSVLSFFKFLLSHPYMTTGKTIALTRQTLVGKVMSLLLNMLSRLVITFLPRRKRLLISWLQSPSAVILEPKNKVWHCFHCFPIYFPWSDGTRCHDLSFLNVEL